MQYRHSGRVDADVHPRPFLARFQLIRLSDEYLLIRSVFHLFPLAKTYLAPIAGYSKKYRRIEDVPQGAKVSIPNDPTNEGRALVELARLGWIEVKPGIQTSRLTLNDILNNSPLKREGFDQIKTLLACGCPQTGRHPDHETLFDAVLVRSRVLRRAAGIA